MNRLLVMTGLVALGACSFSAEIPPDGPGPAITIGFDQMTSDADEKSTAHMITVKLSEISPTDVTVKYQIVDTTASPSDFMLLTPETITVPAGQLTTTLTLQVIGDTVDPEPNETIDFVLLDPVGASIAFGAERHRVTILAKALPRIGFSAPTSMAQEPTDETMMVTLDEASEFPITVDYTVTSTGTSGTDYVLANGTVSFAANETTKSLMLDVLDDNLDEDDETVTVTLANPTNAFVDTAKASHVHTILDTLVDPPPQIAFAAATSTFAESGAAQNIVVSLSAASGRAVSVMYGRDGANSSAANTDITITGTMLTIPAGMTTGNIAVTIVQDTTDEPTETLEVDLSSPTNATLGGQTNHRLSITDDDLVCYGAPNSASDVCLETAPTNAVSLGGGTINTDAGSGDCSNLTIDFGPGQDAACFIVGNTVAVQGAYTVTGARPLVIVGATSITVSNVLDGSSKQAGGTGPGATTNPAGCGAGTNPQGGTGSGGGAGGSFLGAGANGGLGDNGNTNGGLAANAEGAPTKLRAGCQGQAGGGGGGGTAGRGGGAIYLVSGGTINLTNAIINVSGAGGGGGASARGGGGGGSGGMIHLHAATLTVNSNTRLVANGGGGGAGGGDTGGENGSAGFDPTPQNEATQALGGAGGGSGGGTGGDGGVGFAGNSAPGVGSQGDSGAGGGGGGGGGGYILSNMGLGNSKRSAAVITAP